jgi:hypothetical protein
LNLLYQELIERIRGEIPDLARIVLRIRQAWPQAQKPSAARDAYLDSVALNLHSFYSGLERLFELIGQHLDRSLPNGERWHRDLLQQMAVDLTGVRPAVINPQNAQALDEFRRFRHLIRHVYTIHLEPEKMSGLVIVLPDLWSKLQGELLAFADFLEAVAQEDPDKT